MNSRAASIPGPFLSFEPARRKTYARSYGNRGRT